MTTKTLDLPTLESWRWDAGCGIRGAIDAPKYKEYILPLLFYKRLSDVYAADLARINREIGDPALARELSARTATWRTTSSATSYCTAKCRITPRAGNC